jgi:hypothetical protein
VCTVLKSKEKEVDYDYDNDDYDDDDDYDNSKTEAARNTIFIMGKEEHKICSSEDSQALHPGPSGRGRLEERKSGGN